MENTVIGVGCVDRRNRDQNKIIQPDKNYTRKARGNKVNKEPLNFAIIGCGRIAERHAKHIENNGNLLSVCDIDENKAEKLSQSFGNPRFYRPRRAFNKLIQFAHQMGYIIGMLLTL